MKVTFNGTPLTLEGTQVKVGDTAPDFTVVANDLTDVKFSNTKGKRILVAVPSIDTEVCDIEVRKFNQAVSSLDNINVFTISMDLPFAQARWCGNAGIENVTTLSDYKYREFSKNYGLYIKELGIISRAVIVVDEQNKVIYTEYLEEITNEPNYEKAIEAVK